MLSLCIESTATLFLVITLEGYQPFMMKIAGCKLLAAWEPISKRLCFRAADELAVVHWQDVGS